MANNWNPVVFYQGAPIDVSQLNNLQNNITEAWLASNSLMNATTPDGSTQSIIPVVHTDTVSIKLSSGIGNTSINFPGKFTTTPAIVACLASDPGKFQYTVAARAETNQSGKIYVTGPSDKNNTVTVSYIAIQNKIVGYNG